MTAMPADNPPRMTTAKDIACVERAVEQAPEGGTAVEFGPWLGAFSIPIAKRMDLHVVDSFQWTKDHARRVPDVAEIGGNFRAAFEGFMDQNGVSATVHESTFEAFTWDGGAIDLVVIDGPKTAMALKEALVGVAEHLQPKAAVIIKNALAPLYSDIAAYLERLVEDGIFTLPQQDVQRGCSTLILEAGPNVSSLSAALSFDPTRPLRGSILENVTLSADHPYRFVKVIAAIRGADWEAAFDELEEMSPEPALAAKWPSLLKKDMFTASNTPIIDRLSQAVALHHEQSASEELPVAFAENLESTLQGYWTNNSDKDWRSKAFEPEILTRAFDFGYMDWPNKIREHVFGKDVIDIGCGPGLHGIGYIVAGANSYLGLDPILKPDRDRSKNLSKASRKEPFGWTPNQISRLIEPWHASPEALGDTPAERRFDLCTMHNVTEHLMFLEEIFADVAARLRPGGKLLYNHHNFYAWNGHHLPPKNVSKIDMDDPAQREMIDWNHISYDPAPDHYIARGLNRIRLDEIIELTKKYFDIEEMREIPSSPEFGGGRLTDEIRARHSQYEERELTIQNLFCIATVRI